MAYEDYECVIGLEIHAQLKTKTKLFCSCSTEFAAPDNDNTCPVCIGLPGALPTLNEQAIEMAVRLGLALNSKLRPTSTFSRKNYYYPDLPKGYQISQYDEPICEGGKLDFYFEGKKMTVGIERAHLEEDAGKSIHHGTNTLVNLNRSGIPLLEIVSKPEIFSPEQAAEYARTMRAILQYTDVCDGNLEEGSLRCDCNVSVRKKGETKLGTKVEIKNVNSFRFVAKALAYEVERQIECKETGEKIIQETRLYDADKNKTFSMRSKEEAHDYRYFPDPDLLKAVVPAELVVKVQKWLPELPVARAERYQNEFGLSAYDASLLTHTKEMAAYFEKVANPSGNPKQAANWIMGELLAAMNEAKVEISNCPVRPEQLAELIGLIGKGTISGKIAKEVFTEMFQTKKNPTQIVADKGLVMISDTSEIEKIVASVLEKNPTEVTAFRDGKEKLFGFFVGAVMKETKGKASPDVVNQILKKQLKGE